MAPPSSAVGGQPTGRKQALLASALLAAWVAASPACGAGLENDASGGFEQQIAAAYGEAEGLPAEDTLAIAVGRDGVIWAGTAAGLARFSGAPLVPRDVFERRSGGVARRDGRFEPIAGLPAGRVTALAPLDGAIAVAIAHEVWRVGAVGERPRRIAALGGGGAIAGLVPALVDGRSHLLLATGGGLYGVELPGSAPVPAERSLPALETPAPFLELAVAARGVAAAAAGCPSAVAADEGLYLRACAGDAGEGMWRRLLPREGLRSWAPVAVSAVAFDGEGGLWFASPQGVGRRDAGGDGWRLFTAEEGLPLRGAVTAASGPAELWLGFSLGAVRLDRRRDSVAWEYRQGRRWLPHDEVREVAVGDDGTAWLATASGVGRIARVPMSLGEKARLFEAEIDRYHRRTRYGYVDGVRLAAPGDRSRFEQRSSDNDGLWTGMYGAAQCFAYAATGAPEAKARATAAFRALAFLSEVTQGGSHPAPPGFVARSILPTSGPDPNLGRLEEDLRRRRDEDARWKLIAPRWPIDASGEWYWKTDASSDELDGHFFLYALYHDLVAETAEERAAVRRVVTRIVDHLVEHGFALHDHDGKPTRWAVFGPAQLNHDPLWWGERGLNSLSILSYLRLAAHVSGDPKYERAARELIEEHGYAANVRVPKIHTGPGTGNQSDDEMAFMSFWNLLRYERDPELRAIWAHAFHRYWEMERAERNPLFAYLYAASVRGLAWRSAFEETRFGLEPGDEALADARDTLERYPLDRIDWGLRNSHREDVVVLDADRDGHGDAGRLRGMLRSGKVLPIDERFVDHWNHDPWRLDQGGEGRGLADGASFLLPYYLGVYEGFLGE